MSERTDALFDEFVAAHLAGGRPVVQDFIDRAGGEAETLGALIDRYLTMAPPRATTEEDLALMRAQMSGEPPLLVVRTERRLGRGAIVNALMTTLGIDPAKKERVDDYYHELEVGLLDPRGVSGRVFDVLSRVLGIDVRALARPWPVTDTTVLYQRASGAGGEGQPVTPAPAARPEISERDDVDELFTGAH